MLPLLLSLLRLLSLLLLLRTLLLLLVALGLGAYSQICSEKMMREP
jgi:hypothetical protein